MLYEVITLTSDRRHITFICVPVMVEDTITGTLSVDMAFDEKANHDAIVRLLNILGSMIAQFVRIRQDRLEEIERLKEESYNFV